MAESALRNLIPSARDRILSQQGQMPSAPMPQETFRGQAFNTMYDMFGGNSDDPARRAQATRRAEGLVGAGRFAADFTPVVGDALAIDEARDAYRQGNMGQAAILGGLTMLGMVPLVGDAAAKAAKNVINTDYRGSHQPPTRDYGAPLNDLTMLIPEDVYSAAGPRLYGVGNPEVDREAFRSLRDARGKPEAEVTVYRAVPENVSSINEGDWVTTSRKYADMHGESALGGNYKIIEQKAKAKDLFSEGYPYEFGYSPLDMSTEARMQRAAEQGFDQRVFYHGGSSEFDEFANQRRGNYFTDNPKIADIYAENAERRWPRANNASPNVMPVRLRGRPLVVSDQRDGSGGWLSNNLADVLGVDLSGTPVARRGQVLREEANKQGYGFLEVTDMDDLGGRQTQFVALDPSNIRSVNAAFDPVNRGSANILATAAGGTIGLSALRQLMPQEEERPIE